MPENRNPAPTVYVVDAYSLIFQVFYALPRMTSADGRPTNAIFGFAGDLLRLRRKKPDYLVVVFDAPGKTFREDLYPAYKAQRPPIPEELQRQLPTIREIISALRIPLLEVPGYEADDVMATLAAQGEKKGYQVILCTNDKDCRQLISDLVFIYHVRKDTLIDREALRQEWGITPEQVVDYLALVGDSVDNVPGVPGVGPKTAAKLLQEFGTLENLLAHVSEIRQAKLREALRQNTENILLARRLVKLCREVPITLSWQDWRLVQPDVPRLRRLLHDLDIRRYDDDLRALSQDDPPSETGLLFSDPKKQFSESDYQLIDTPEKFEQFCQQLQQQSRFALDVETTGLDALQAEIVGLAFCWQKGKAYYVPLQGPLGQNVLPRDLVLKALAPLLCHREVGKVNQNIKYDALVLRQAGCPLEGIAGDPMIADYLLEPGRRRHNLEDLSQRYLGHTPIAISELIGERSGGQKRMSEVDVQRVAEYAAEDADLAWRLCEVLEHKLQQEGLLRLYQEVEVPLIAVLADMEFNGVKLDTHLLRQLSRDYDQRLHALEEDIYRLAGRPFAIQSLEQLREVLFDELKLPSLRKTAITGEESTAQDVLEALASAGHELPRKVLEYRQLAKLKSTYLDALPRMVNPKTGRVHASFNQTVTATGRLSTSRPNLQNIPVRSESGEQIRQAFIAPAEDWVLLTADYSQIELRLLAHCSEDAALRRAFEQDLDIHAAVAAQVFGVPVEQVTKEQRRVAKTINFGIIYGLSAFGLAQRLGISQEEAAAFIDAYYQRYPGVLVFQERVLAECREKGYVQTILGRRRKISGVRSQSSYRQRNAAEREALNTVIQGSAADLIKVAMVRLWQELRTHASRARLILQIHDELILEVPRCELNEVAQRTRQAMTGALALRVPLKVDLAFGPNWLQVTSWSEQESLHA
ncbi:MAG: DNA polymerase I [Gemmatales bacterium]|nr:DNA polymerase I [Gemmatales bacterium]MDW8221440.1 DNA polymerase I [Gemmatales bacterium]